MTHLAEPVACPCDDPHVLKQLISVGEARDLIEARTSAVKGTETEPLVRAAGRVLSAPIRAQSAAPPFTNAAMDGYAINGRGMNEGGPWVLDVIDRVAAGEAKTVRLNAGGAVRIFTGAPVPAEATAVGPQEDILVTGTTIKVVTPPREGQHIRRMGEDLAKGAIVLETGTQLETKHIACAAAAGCGEVSVYRQLRVSIIATGNELTPLGLRRSGGEIWGVNSPTLAAELAIPGVALGNVETAADSPKALKRQMARLAAKSDLVITTGGISVGEEDHVKAVLRALGGEILFSGVALKPGKPVSFGQISGATWLGLPGNPLSAWVTWNLFGKPLLARLGGRAMAPTKGRLVVCSSGVRRRPGRCEYRLATLVGQIDGQDAVELEPAVHSGRVGALRSATGLAHLPGHLKTLQKGKLVTYLPFAC